IPPAATPERAHRVLAALVPRDRYLMAHINLITLGRRVCRPRAPACPACPLRGACAYARRMRGSTRVRREGPVPPG
ncbi:MAG TPA: hypothetical protein VJ144_02275, partial [Candidatus Polarisedimenticolia bacterium]|nr:hypothetical protein [Candidatus Polarisedimenticolia bacterium]